MKRRVMKRSVILVTLLLTALALTGQTLFMEKRGSDVPELEFRFLRPFFEGGDSLSFISGIYDLTLSMPFKAESSYNWVVSMPFSYMYMSEDGYSESNSAVGNLYVGLQQRLKAGVNKGLTGSAGLFLPLAPEDDYFATFLGYLSDPARVYKYMPNTLTFRGTITYHRYWEMAFLKVELGPDVLFPTKKSGADMEVLVHYGIGGGLKLGNFALAGEFFGYSILTQEVDDIGDRFFNYINFGVTWTKGRIRPGIFYMIPFDEDFRDFLDGVIGIKVEVDLKK